MAVQDVVEKLVIRLAPEPICDDCVADTLNLPEREQAYRRTRELAGSNGFVRSRHVCSMCGVAKMAIGKVTSPS